MAGKHRPVGGVAGLCAIGALCALAACGGSGGGTPAPTPDPFVVTGTSPTADERVDPTVQPSIRFSRALGPALPASAASLSSPIAAIPASIAASGATLTLAPASSLVWGGHYTVALTRDILSEDGQALSPTGYSFDVAAPAWGAPSALASAPFSTGTPVVAGNRSGQAFAVWQQDIDGSGTWNIHAARLDSTAGAWSTPVVLKPAARAQLAPVVAVDAAGNAIAAWIEDTGSGVATVHAARFVAAAGSWTPASPIQAGSSQGGLAPQVVLDGEGNGTVVWQQETGVGAVFSIQAARFDRSADAWQPAVELDPGVGGRGPQLAAGAAGDAVAVWERVPADGIARIVAARWSASTGAWGAAQPLQASGLAGANPQAAVSPDGNAAVVWSQTEPNGTLTVQTARFDAAAGAWGAPVALSPATGVETGNLPQVQADVGGNLLVLWQQYRGGNVYSLSAARYDATLRQWGEPVAIETLTAALNPYGAAPTLVVDEAGNATAAWTQEVDGRSSAFQSRFVLHEGRWSAAGVLSGPVAVADRVHATVDGSGNVVATWGVRDAFGSQAPWWALATGP